MIQWNQLKKLKLKKYTHNIIKTVVIIILSLFFLTSTINANGASYCPTEYSPEECQELQLESSKFEASKPKEYDELGSLEKNLISNKKEETKEWYVQYLHDIYSAKTGKMELGFLGSSAFPSMNLFVGSIVIQLILKIAFVIYYILMLITTFATGSTIPQIIGSLGNFLNNDILQLHDSNGLAIRILLVIASIASIKILVDKSTSIKSALASILSIFLAVFIFWGVARSAIDINNTMNDIASPLAKSLNLNHVKDVKDKSLVTQNKAILFENIALSQFVLSNFNDGSLKKVGKDRVEKLLTQNNYADIEAEKKPAKPKKNKSISREEKHGPSDGSKKKEKPITSTGYSNNLALSIKNDGGVVYIHIFLAFFQLISTIAFFIFEMAFLIIILSFQIIFHLRPAIAIVILIRTIINNSYFMVGDIFSSLGNYLLKSITWCLASNLGISAMLLANLLISASFNELSSINSAAPLILTIILCFLGILMMAKYKEVMKFYTSLTKNAMSMVKESFSDSSSPLSSINDNLVQPAKDGLNNIVQSTKQALSKNSKNDKTEIDSNETTINDGAEIDNPEVILSGNNVTDNDGLIEDSPLKLKKRNREVVDDLAIEDTKNDGNDTDKVDSKTDETSTSDIPKITEDDKSTIDGKGNDGSNFELSNQDDITNDLKNSLNQTSSENTDNNSIDNKPELKDKDLFNDNENKKILDKENSIDDFIEFEDSIFSKKLDKLKKSVVLNADDKADESYQDDFSVENELSNNEIDDFIEINYDRGDNFEPFRDDTKKEDE